MEEYIQNDPIDFRTKAGWMAWIDILGFRNRPLKDMENILAKISFLSTVAGDRKVNLNIIGDAICITENGRDDGRFVLQVAINISGVLFKQEYAHRGYVSKGQFAFKWNTFLPYVTGPGIVETILQEGNMKFCGLAIRNDLVKELKGHKIFDEQETLIFFDFKKIFSKQTILTTREHLKRAYEFSKAHKKEHRKIKNTYIWSSRLVKKLEKRKSFLKLL